MIEPKRLGAVVLSVRDLDASLAWYRRKFGFEKLYADAPNSKGIAIGKGGVEIHLNPIPNPADATAVATDRQVCVQLLCLEVDASDLDRVADEFPEDKNIVVLDGHPKYRSRIVEDIDGHAIELYAWKQDCRITASCGRRGIGASEAERRAE